MTTCYCEGFYGDLPRMEAYRRRLEEKAENTEIYIMQLRRGSLEEAREQAALEWYADRIAGITTEIEEVEAESSPDEPQEDECVMCGGQPDYYEQSKGLPCPGCRAEKEEPPHPDDPKVCPACGGRGRMLGGLGNLKHWRCRDCGFDYNDFAEA